MTAGGGDARATRRVARLDAKRDGVAVVRLDARQVASFVRVDDGAGGERACPPVIFNASRNTKLS